VYRKNAECEVYVIKSFYETSRITWVMRGEVGDIISITSMFAKAKNKVILNCLLYISFLA
jgi:hypothetical protein